jgi:hypothetical protein
MKNKLKIKKCIEMANLRTRKLPEKICYITTPMIDYETPKIIKSINHLKKEYGEYNENNIKSR